MVTILGDRDATRPSSTPVLFSSALIAFLAGGKGAKTESEGVAELSSAESNRKRKATNHPILLPSKEASTRGTDQDRASTSTQRWNVLKHRDDANYDFVWPALVAFGGAGLFVYFTRRPLKTLNLRSALSRFPIPVSSPTLLYSSLGINIICSATILYMYERQRTSTIQNQLNTLSTWEEQATRRAKSRTLALQEHYESHLEALGKLQKEAEGDMKTRWSAIQASQISALGSITSAEQAAWRRVREAAADVKRLEGRVSKLERQRDLCHERLDNGESVLRGVRKRLNKV
jgi:hypothetical protein